MDKENQKNFSETIPDGFGVNIHFAGRPIDIDLISDAGFKVVRFDLIWSQIEKEQGKYDFKNTGYDDLTEAMLDEGIRPYYILVYSNELYEKNKSVVTKEGRDAFVRYAGEAAARYKNNSIIWEIWNEPNGGFWEPKPNFDEYSLLVKEVSEEIKKKDPSGIVVAPALQGIDDNSLKWLEEIFKRGTLDHIDALSVHPYRATIPETVEEDYKKVQKLMAKYTKKEIPIIAGEWGYSTANGWIGLHLSERTQAEYLSRMFLINMLNDIPVSIWYDWKNDGIDQNNHEHNFGIRQNDVRIPKEAYMAMNNLTYMLSDYKLIRRIETDEKDNYFLEFKNDNEEVILVCWTAGIPKSVDFPYGNSKGRIISMLGEDQGYFDSVVNSKIELTGSPTYIRIQEKID